MHEPELLLLDYFLEVKLAVFQINLDPCPLTVFDFEQFALLRGSVHAEPQSDRSTLFEGPPGSLVTPDALAPIQLDVGVNFLVDRGLLSK